jgi:hypothetical protein
MEATWQPQWQAQWGGLEAGMYVPSQPATGVVTADMTHALSRQQSGTQVEIHVACKYLFPSSLLPSCLRRTLLCCVTDPSARTETW